MDSVFFITSFKCKHNTLISVNHENFSMHLVRMADEVRKFEEDAETLRQENYR